MPTLYVTVPESEERSITKELVNDRLVACVNAVSCRSLYRWEGDVVREPESILFMKTSPERVEDAIDRINDIHPHDVPCVEVFDEATIVEPFKRWRDAAVR